MSQINLGSGDQGSPPTEAQKEQLRAALLPDNISTFTTTERDKLEGIETGADVTDTTNVVAALTPGSNITIAADGTISSNDISLSDEQVQDIIGAMVTGNSESGITVTYDDETGSIVFSVESQTDENFTTADHSKLDGIEAGADVTPTWVPDADPSYATETYVDSEVSNLVDSAPGTLDTLNELADALGDDPNFATTITNSIGTKLPLAGGTMSGDIDMGENDLTNVGNIGMAGSTIDVAGGSGTLTIDGDITVTGDVNGRDLSDDGTKLDGIEAGATADQSDAEIKTAYENNADTNAFTDADHTKLDGIEASADVTDTTNVVAALTAGTNVTIAGDGTISSTDTNDNTQLTDEEVQDIVGGMVSGNTEGGIAVTYDDTSGTLDFAVTSQTDENFTTADHSKLDGIESGATGDQTAAEIRTLVDSATDSNVFTDADNTKLGGIETGADVTDTTNVTAAGALMDSEVTNLDQVKAFDSSDYATSAQGTLADSATQPGDLGTAASLDVGTSADEIIQLDGSARLPAVDASQLTNLPSGATELSDLSDVNTSTATNRNVLIADGIDFESRALVEADISDLGSYLTGITGESLASLSDVTTTGAELDAIKTKVDGIEASADVTDTTNVVASLTAGTNITIAGDGTISSSGGGGGGGLSDEEVQDIVGGMVTGNSESGIAVTYDDTEGTLDFSVASQTDENFTTADHSKLDGIEAGATGDQTASEIKALVDSATDSNVFTDADHSKLDGIEASADVTDTTNVVSALTAGTNITIAGDGTISSTDTNTQLSDEEVQDVIGGMVEGNTESGITVTYQDDDGTLDFTVASQTDENFTTADHSKLDGISSGADVTPAWVPSSDPSYATETYVDTEVSNLVDSAPGTLDTLNELAAALGDDPSFATTVSNSIGTKLPLAGGTITGNIVMSGSETVDGRDLSVDGTKLDGIESGATADQTASEIRTLVDSATDSNVFTDADHSKLDGIESGADVTDTANVTSAGALMDSEVTNLADVKAFDSTDYATAAQGTLADSATQPGDALSSLDTTVTGSELNNLKTKLDGIESGATADQTGAEIKSAYEGESDTNAFTDADHSKLDGIEASATADQTASEIRTLVDSATDSNVFTDADHSKLDAIEASADVTPAWVPSSDPSYATETYVDTEVSNLVDSAPGTLDTLNELAAALGDDANFSTTVTNSIATKLPLAGGTMSGDIDMGANDITNVGKITVVNTSTDDSLLITTTEDSSDAAPVLTFKRNSSSVASGDYLGQLKFKGENDADQELVYAKVTSKISDETDTTEDGLLEFALRKAGSLNIGARLTSTDLKLLNGTSLDMGGETITNVGNVDGRDIATDGTKLDGIEASATADQTGSEIKSLYEGESDTNAFTDADHSKLDGIESSADVTDATNVTAAGALMDSEVTNLAQVKAFDSSDYASALGADDNYVTDAEKTVIGNTSGTNTGDQDLSSYQLQPSEGAFANGDKTKLDGISAGADVTPSWVPSSDPSYATETYVDTEVANVIDSAPGTLDTLNELAAALGDDPNFATTVTNSIAAKLPLAGGTMSGDITMGANGINFDDGATIEVGGGTGDLTITGNFDVSGGSCILLNGYGRGGFKTYSGLSGTITPSGGVAFGFANYFGNTGAYFATNNSGGFEIYNSALTASAGFSSTQWAATGFQATSPGSAYNPAFKLDGTSGDEGGFYLSGTDQIWCSDRTDRVKLKLTGELEVLSDLDVTGDIIAAGTVDGRDVAADGTKLDGIESSADVTDATNVTAAGALMDSEVTNLAQVKAFDSSDYATAAQGTTADSALQSGDIDTLAELNSVVTDATLIDTADSRLSDSRTCDNTFDSAATSRTNLGLGTAAVESAASLSPAGGIQAYAGSSSPTGWLICDGSAVSRTTYSDLFAVISTTYGVGDGSSTFNLPNISGRVIAGKEASATLLTSGGSGVDGATLGSTGGSETHTLDETEMPTHSHDTSDRYDTGSDGSGSGSRARDNAITTLARTTTTAGGDQPHQNTQPTIVLNYIIKT